ncbi:MAG: YihY/virulence factor BrkB family protein [Polyangiaceae bacterium]
MRRLHLAYELGSKTLERFSKDRGDLLAAALAFNALLSIAPLIIVAVAVAGIVLGQGAAHQEAMRALRDALGAKGAATVDAWVGQASEGGEVASVVGLTLTVLAGSRFGTQLRSALNQVWNIDVYTAEGFRSTVTDYVQRRAFAFVLTLAAGPLLLLVFASRALLTGFHETLFAATPWQGFMVQALQLAFSVASVALISAVVLRYVPDTRVAWKNTLVGGLVTSVLFTIGNALVSIYLGHASVAAAYGAAGSLVVVLLWLYFSAQFFLVGAEFTRVYAEHFGDRLSREERREVETAKRSAHGHAHEGV